MTGNGAVTLCADIDLAQVATSDFVVNSDLVTRPHARGNGLHRLNLEAPVMGLIVAKRRYAGAALRFLRRLLKNQHVEPQVIVTDGLRPCGAALQPLYVGDRHRPGCLRGKNPAENSHLSIRSRERKMQRLKSRVSAQRSLEVHVAVCSMLNIQRHLPSRRAMYVLRACSKSVWSGAVA